MSLTSYEEQQSYYHFIRRYWWFAEGLIWFSLPLLCWGSYLVYYQTPPDYMMGDTIRWLFPHVASAFTAMVLYLFMAGFALWSFIKPDPIRKVVMLSIAPVGAALTAIAIVTGMIWSKPVWGTWLVWDMRTGSTFILLGIFLVVFFLSSSISNFRLGYLFIRMIIITGVSVIFIVHNAPEYFNTIHQMASLSNFDSDSYSPEYLGVLSYIGGGTAVFSAGLIISMTKRNILKSIN